MIDKKIKRDRKTYLCFDLGTTRIKSALLDSQGNIKYLNSKKAVSYQEGDSVIQKPEEYYGIVEKQIKKIAKTHPQDFINAESLILSGQMAGILSVDKNWEVVLPWTYSVDNRANKYLNSIENKLSYRIRRSSGGVPFMAAKIKWIKDEFPKEYKKSNKFINLITYVAGRLAVTKSEDAFIDYSVLAMSGLADIRKGTWNKGIIEELDFDIEKLPRIVPPYDIIGTIPKKKFATRDDIRILAGIGDQIAGFIGAGVLKKGDLIDVAGTYSVLGYAADRFIPDIEKNTLSSIYSGIEDIYYHLGVVAAGGYLYNWFKNKFEYNVNRFKGPVSNTRGLFFIPHIGGRLAPSQPYYKGTFYGLEWKHGLNSIYSSMLECIGYEYGFMLENIRRLNSFKGVEPGFVKVIGGGAKNDIWNKIKANILELEYHVMRDSAYEILGNYLIARYGSDIRKGYRDKPESEYKKIQPDKDTASYYRDQKIHYRKVVDHIGGTYREMDKE